MTKRSNKAASQKFIVFHYTVEVKILSLLSLLDFYRINDASLLLVVKCIVNINDIFVQIICWVELINIFVSYTHLTYTSQRENNINMQIFFPARVPVLFLCSFTEKAI